MKKQVKRGCKVWFCLFICTSNILDIHKYLMKRTWYKIMFVLMFVFVFIVLLSNIVNGSNHAKCISLRNQKVIWMYINQSGLNHIQPTVINLHHNEYSQEFQDFQSAVKLDITCVGSCNTLNDLSNKVRRRKLFFLIKRKISI